MAPAPVEVPELLRLILSNVLDSATLASCARVSRLWHEHAIHWLWHGGINFANKMFKTPLLPIIQWIGERDQARLKWYLSRMKALTIQEFVTWKKYPPNDPMIGLVEAGLAGVDTWHVVNAKCVRLYTAGKTARAIIDSINADSVVMLDCRLPNDLATGGFWRSYNVRSTHAVKLLSD